jgi:hypothetical protein
MTVFFLKKLDNLLEFEFRRAILRLLKEPLKSLLIANSKLKLYLNTIVYFEL